MEYYMEEIMPYKQLQKKVMNPDIVVPDTNTSNRGRAGAIFMYNESSGLRLDGDKRLCIAKAEKADIEAGTSVNKPIVPWNFSMALERFIGGMYKKAIVPKGGTFEIKPGMFAIIFPWDKAWFYTASGTPILKSSTTGAPVGGGTSFVFATGTMNSNNEMDAKGTNYDVAVLSISGISSTSSHNTYPTSSGYCYFKNDHSDTSGTGYAYVYYLG